LIAGIVNFDGLAEFLRIIPDGHLDAIWRLGKVTRKNVSM